MAHILLSEQRERTAKAEKDAAEAKIIASNAGEGALKALADVAAANERAGRLEVEAAKQRERAAKAEKELLEVQERLRPRHLPPELRQRLTDALRSSDVKGRIHVNCVDGDAEGCEYAREIRACLEAAGWPLEPAGGMVGISGYGLLIMVRDDKTTPIRASALLRIMRSVALRRR
jgi:hypothetical protein